MTAQNEATDNTKREDAIKDLLEYCRGDRADLNAGQDLSNVFFRRPYEKEDTSKLYHIMKKLIKDELELTRNVNNINRSANEDWRIHLENLDEDVKKGERRKPLRIWSLLWGYYICNIPSEEMSNSCTLSVRRIQELIEEGRKKYIADKIEQEEQTLSGVMAPRYTQPPVEDIVRNVRALRGPGSAPPVPAVFVGRNDDMENMKGRLGIVPPGEAAPLHVLTAVSGWPGVGKTTLAAALAYDSDVQKQFPDGILWASLGKNPSIFGELVAWGRALGVQMDVVSAEEASAQLRAMLRDKRMLLIVDDVWDEKHVPLFRIGGRGCALLVTTRLNKVADNIATGNIYVLGVLKAEDALELLREIAPDVVAREPVLSQELVEDLEGLPLAIQVAGRLLNVEIKYGFDIDDLLQDIREGAKLIEAQPPADRVEIANETTPTVAALLQRSTDLLKAHEQDCYAYLGAFAPKPATFDADAMKEVWEVDDPKPIIRTLIDHGLLEHLNDETGRYWMHAILVTHARSFLTE